MRAKVGQIWASTDPRDVRRNWNQRRTVTHVMGGKAYLTSESPRMSGSYGVALADNMRAVQNASRAEGVLVPGYGSTLPRVTVAPVVLSRFESLLVRRMYRGKLAREPRFAFCRRRELRDVIRSIDRGLNGG